ncbi:hypothetical protein Val02_86690 [Virgisporangium aliadipatigenens]|uniref:Uncharacterized protein n=1 Tax=Virgisporangium aliadipatigenens TaxID=741659 RepID=A0A8J3YWD8_9ACTN|nr:hypothetical protein [Virgisporangium aliadipatigenens]GIJ51783.1 hypothetical protein Val02_86690 [Virgisporangium aliadipatigenens]
MSTVLELESTASEISDDLLADLVGDTDRADEIGELMIDQSIAPTAGAIVALSRLANC